MSFIACFVYVDCFRCPFSHLDHLLGFQCLWTVLIFWCFGIYAYMLNKTICIHFISFVLLFSQKYRLINDVLSLTNPRFDYYIHLNYPKENEIEDPVDIGVCWLSWHSSLSWQKRGALNWPVKRDHFEVLLSTIHSYLELFRLFRRMEFLSLNSNAFLEIATI